MATFYLDYVNGSDSVTTTPLGWWRVSYTGGSGTAPAADETVTGAVSLATAKLTVAVNPTSGSWGAGTAAGIMYFYGKSGTFQAETVNGAGGASFTIAADLQYCAWKTITSGASAARIAPGDVIRIAKSADPTSLGQNAQWTTVTRTGGGLPAATNIVSSSNATPIQITSNSHGIITGDVAQVLGHATNTNANGNWIATYVDDNNFTLDGSVGNGVGGATGTVQNITAKAVVLTTAVTQSISDCESNWTAGAQTTSSLITAASKKEGNSSVEIITAAICNANQILAKYGLPASLDLSGYQQLSFWLANVTASSPLTAGALQIRLYQDAACTILVETLSVQAIASSALWVPITINKGSALSGTVQGIAVYTTVQINAKTLRVDNFIACKASSSADSLSLQSLISKNSLAKGGNEPWLALESITGQGTINSGRILLLDGMRGYYGVTESVVLHKRETTKIATLPTATSTYFNTITDNGTIDNIITYAGGWDNSTNEQNGDTYFDGLNRTGTCFRTDKSYVAIVNFSACRWARIFYNASLVSTNFTMNINNGNNCAGSFYYEGSTSYNLSFTAINTCNNSAGVWLYLYQSNSVFNVTNCNSNDGAGISLRNSCSNNIFNITTCSNNGYGIGINPSSENLIINNIFSVLNCDYNSTNAILFGTTASNNYIYNCSMSNNGNACVSNSRGINHLKNCTLNGAEFTGALNFNNTRIYSQNHDNTPDNHYIYTDLGNIQSDTTNRHTLSGICWKLSPTNAARNIYYPLDLSIAKIACNSNSQVTVKAWFKKSHATAIGASLVCRGKQLSGVSSDVVATAPDNTDYNELSISFTPTEVGVIEIYAYAYYISSTAESVYVDDMSISQL